MILNSRRHPIRRARSLRNSATRSFGATDPRTGASSALGITASTALGITASSALGTASSALGTASTALGTSATPATRAAGASFQKIIVISATLLEIAVPTRHRTGSTVLHGIVGVASERPGGQYRHLAAREAGAAAVATRQRVAEIANRRDLVGGDRPVVVPHGCVDDVLFVLKLGEVVHACRVAVCAVRLGKCEV